MYSVCAKKNDSVIMISVLVGSHCCSPPSNFETYFFLLLLNIINILV